MNVKMDKITDAILKYELSSPRGPPDFSRGAPQVKGVIMEHRKREIRVVEILATGCCGMQPYLSLPGAGLTNSSLQWRAD
jgi:hypothetical protein